MKKLLERKSDILNPFNTLLFSFTAGGGSEQKCVEIDFMVNVIG